MSQIAEVAKLQSIDDEIRTLETTRAEVERRLKGNDELVAARISLDTANTALVLLQREQRRLDGEVSSLDDRVTHEERRLYDGSVKNPKELSSIQHEVETLRSKRSAIEDASLEVLSQIEQAEAAQKECSGLVGRLQSAWDAESQELQQEAARLMARLMAAQEKRSAQASALPRSALALYERVRARRGALVVAVIRGGTCSGCRISLPDAVKRRAMAPDTLVQCPNCERILAVA